jgi:hypothetical protein
MKILSIGAMLATIIGTTYAIYSSPSAKAENIIASECSVISQGDNTEIHLNCPIDETHDLGGGVGRFTDDGATLIVPNGIHGLEMDKNGGCAGTSNNERENIVCDRN